MTGKIYIRWKLVMLSTDATLSTVDVVKKVQKINVRKAMSFFNQKFVTDFQVQKQINLQTMYNNDIYIHEKWM